MSKLTQTSIEKARVGGKPEVRLVPGLYLRIGERRAPWNFFRFGHPRPSSARTRSMIWKLPASGHAG